MILIRNTFGEVFNEVENPTIVMDKDSGVMLKIGEYEDMENYYNVAYASYISHPHPFFHKMANDLVLMSLPKDQELIDKVFNISDYAGTVYKELVENGTISSNT